MHVDIGQAHVVEGGEIPDDVKVPVEVDADPIRVGDARRGWAPVLAPQLCLALLVVLNGVRQGGQYVVAAVVVDQRNDVDVETLDGLAQPRPGNGERVVHDSGHRVGP